MSNKLFKIMEKINPFDFSEKYQCSDVNISRFKNKIRSNKTSTIEEHENDYQRKWTKTDLKWPFVGNRFDRVQWKSGIEQDNVKTKLKVKNDWQHYFMTNVVGKTHYSN